MEVLIEDLQWYCREKLKPFMEKPENELVYPKTVIDDLSELGIFGLNIPKEFGGYGLGMSHNVQVMNLLGQHWLSLPALLGTHLRANMYFNVCGTKEQKNNFLSKMAKGQTIFSHAYHEKATKDLKKISTTVENVDGKYFLNGSKDWVTNSYHSQYYIVIARNISNDNKPVAVILNSNNDGISRETEHIRPGIKGITLTSVTFNNIAINENEDIIGGKDFSVDEFIKNYKLGSSISFSARAIGASIAVLKHTKEFINSYKNRESGNEIIAYKYALLYSKYLSAEKLLNEVVSNFSTLPDKTATAYLTKVHCSNTLQEIINGAIMLKGGYGYASQDGFLQRMYRDAASLPLIDTPNDILLYRSGLELLK